MIQLIGYAGMLISAGVYIALKRRDSSIVTLGLVAFASGLGLELVLLWLTGDRV